MTAAAISKKTFAAIALETTPGTAATTPTLYIPNKIGLKNKQPQTYVDDDRGTVDKNYTSVAGTRHAEGDWKGDVFADTTPYALLLAMGAVVTTQPDATNLPTVHKHTFSLADVPPAATIFKSYVGKQYVASYCAVEKLSFKWNSTSKTVENDLTFKSLWFVPYTGSTLVPVYTQVQPFAGYMPILKFNGTQSFDVSDMEIDFTRKIDLFYPSAGVPDFSRIDYGERECKIKFTARFDTDIMYGRYTGHNDDALTVDMTGALIGTDAGTNYFQELNFNFPIIRYDDMEHDLGKTSVLIKASATVIPGLTANSLFSAYMQNIITSYTT